MDIPVGRPRQVARRWLGRYFVAAAALFAAGVAMGWMLIDAGSPEAVAEFSAAQSPFPSRLTVRTILVNNLLALTIVLAGIVTFAVPTAASLLFNGLLIGFILGAPDGPPLGVALALVLPHGLLELPALWLAGGVSFRVTHRLIRYLRGQEEVVLTPMERYEAVLLTVLAVGLIVAAAVIEATLTLEIAEHLTGRELPRP